MEEKREITFNVLCYNPEVDESSYFKSYDVALEKGITVLRALNYIKDHVDPSLTLRFFCQAGICGSCAVRVNGMSRLACTAQVWDELSSSKTKDTLTIEPLNNFEVLKDLVVDIDPMIEKLKKYQSWVVPATADADLGKKECVVQEEEFQPINAATDCILCAACYSECTISESSKQQFISPLVILRAYRMNKDTRDTQSDERLKVLTEDHGVWDCTHCYRCVDACVKNIPIMEAIHGVREEAIKRGMKSPGYRHAMAFKDDTQKLGRLNEFSLPVRTLGILGAVSQIPFAIKMGRKGRIPPILPHKIASRKQVDALLADVEQDTYNKK